jgi:hypothetical protein
MQMPPARFAKRDHLTAAHRLNRIGKLGKTGLAAGFESLEDKVYLTGQEDKVTALL